MKRSNLFITATGISFAFCVTSIAYADTPFLRQEQLQEQKDPACHQCEPEHGSADETYRR